MTTTTYTTFCSELLLTACAGTDASLFLLLLLIVDRNHLMLEHPCDSHDLMMLSCFRKMPQWRPGPSMDTLALYDFYGMLDTCVGSSHDLKTFCRLVKAYRYMPIGQQRD